MILTEKEIRQLAKDETDIARVGNKKIENLIDELAKAGFEGIEIKEEAATEDAPEPAKESPAADRAPEAKPALEQNANPKDWQRVLLKKVNPKTGAVHPMWVLQRDVQTYLANGWVQ